MYYVTAFHYLWHDQDGIVDFEVNVRFLLIFVPDCPIDLSKKRPESSANRA